MRRNNNVYIYILFFFGICRKEFVKKSLFSLKKISHYAVLDKRLLLSILYKTALIFLWLYSQNISVTRMIRLNSPTTRDHSDLSFVGAPRSSLFIHRIPWSRSRIRSSSRLSISEVQLEKRSERANPLQTFIVFFLAILLHSANDLMVALPVACLAAFLCAKGADAAPGRLCFAFV